MHDGERLQGTFTAELRPTKLLPSAFGAKHSWRNHEVLAFIAGVSHQFLLFEIVLKRFHCEWFFLAHQISLVEAKRLLAA
jgi:hypothetical protein